MTSGLTPTLSSLSYALALEWSSVGSSVLMVLFIGASILLILAVLIQKPQGGGLATAFGAGSGSGQTAFGARTGDALTIMTVILFALYLIAAVVLVWTTTPKKPAAEGEAAVAPVTTPANGTTPATGTNGATTPGPDAGTTNVVPAPAPAPATPPAATGEASPPVDVAPTAPAPTGAPVTPPSSTPAPSTTAPGGR